MEKSPEPSGNDVLSTVIQFGWLVPTPSLSTNPASHGSSLLVPSGITTLLLTRWLNDPPSW